MIKILEFRLTKLHYLVLVLSLQGAGCKTYVDSNPSAVESPNPTTVCLGTTINGVAGTHVCGAAPLAANICAGTTIDGVAGTAACAMPIKVTDMTSASSNTGTSAIFTPASGQGYS